jgi:hypothetical protein
MSFLQTINFLVFGRIWKEKLKKIHVLRKEKAVNKHQLRVKKYDQANIRICAIHPVSPWKDGYKRCYWEFKLKQDCKQLQQKGGDK